MPLLWCEIVVLRQLGEFIIVCTALSLSVALLLLAPMLSVASEVAIHFSAHLQRGRPQRRERLASSDSCASHADGVAGSLELSLQMDAGPLPASP